jgi:L-lactate dehydrogenase complex protein LldF
MRLTTDRFSENVREALADRKLQGALSKATVRFMASRSEAFAEYPEGEALRDQARRIKEKTLAALGHYLAELAEAVRRAGGTVHWAADAREAQEIVVGLARQHGVRLAVKSKSMTTEEIGLNEALEEAGVEPVETDLGEYIIQLAHEAPSHIIAPAIHKSKEDVTELFVDKLGSPRLSRHQELALEARRHLREKFRRAEMGITGVNFAVADTGSIAIVENEGNARLSTSLPRVHVAVMGMEKVIPDLASLAVFLKILARSATGQKMSSYVSLITGPRREGEEDGPEVFHLIVLDNGRSRLLADPHLRESLYCIRCGACLNACPVYRHAGGHAYGWVYSGPIGAVITPSFVGHRRASELPFASSLCGACRDVCPVRINIPRLLLEQRSKVITGEEVSWSPSRPVIERLLVRLFVYMMSSERRYRFGSRLAYWLSRPFVVDGMMPRPPGLSAWSRFRNFPAPARESFRERFERRRG